ncbi:hypothetical protein HYH03_006352 [Edaphochlamys debaryana]|uniref:Uncharacterized protein n=1 Tax=Edaphochlamys debaryana TaxID=47281 RepID=A0A836C1A8_9CHLO|nr:hypothetical protein HYH03_006352 [Edaphochlamys debaryana]|eukprot:KAG2495403.1 hypothetical protein HYH03_006352 [Edaphochlamys debaryana]
MQTSPPPQGKGATVVLAAAAAWLPPAWPHLLQLLSDPHHDVRSAAAALLGHLGAALACGREPRLAGRLPPGALLDWGLAVLGHGSALPAAQRMTPEAREAALCALHACASALPSPRLEPYAQSLLRLVCGLLEAPATPLRLLGPLMRQLMAALPAAPLAALGQAFGDLVDLLCGWALGGGVAEQDRHQVRLVLHALRPQWHSHPDLTASLTANMLGDAAEAAAAAAAAAASSKPSEAAAQAASCLQLAQLLTDILSAASLRPVSRLASPSPAAQSGAGPAAPPPPQQPPPALPLALSALLPTRPAADTARHIAQLYPRFLSILKLLRQTLAGLDASDLAAAGIDLLAGSSAASGGGSGGDRSSGADAAWPGRLCGSVEALAESTASVVAALDARDVEDVWKAVCSSASDGGGSGSKAAAGAGAEGRASLEDLAARLKTLTVSQAKPGAEVAVGASELWGDILGPVGAAAAAAGLRLANVEGASAAAAATLPLGRREVLRLWALQEGLKWAFAALGGAAPSPTAPPASTVSISAAAGPLSGAPGPGPDAVALVGLSAHLLRFAEAEPRPPSGSSGGSDGGSGGAGVVGRGGDERAAQAAAAFSLAVLQAACSKALLPPSSAARVEALAWRALRAAMPAAMTAAPEALGSSGVADDLRIDERLMQLLRAIRSLPAADPDAAARGLPGAVRDLAVTPLGPRAGLIQWVPATTSMLAVFRAWQGSVLERHAAMAAARAEGAAKAAAEGVPPPPELEPPPAAAASRPMDLFYATLVPALQAAGDGLPGVQRALGQWEAASASAANQVVALLRGAPEQFPVDTALAAQRAQGLLARRGAWLAEARAAEARCASIAAAVQSKHLLPASAADEAQPGSTGAQPGQGGPQGQTPGSQTPPLPAGASAGPSQVADDAN